MKTPATSTLAILCLQGGEDMARRRLQQKGDLFKQGGWWKLRWKEDRRKADGSIEYAWSRAVWIGQSEGAGHLTEKREGGGAAAESSDANAFAGGFVNASSCKVDNTRRASCF